MKLKETLLFTQHDSIDYNYDEIGDEHVSSSLETPLRENAFEISDVKKKEIIADHFKGIMETLGLDLNDDSLMGTPHRVAKMYVDEIFNGLNPKNKPKIALFENKYQYNEMLVEKNITFYSCMSKDINSIFQALMINFSKPNHPLLLVLLLSFLIPSIHCITDITRKSG